MKRTPLAVFLGLLLSPIGVANATGIKDCPPPVRDFTGKYSEAKAMKEPFDQCRKLLADYRQLEKEWDSAFASARSDLLKARAEKNHDASWAALKRIFLSMNLREPDLAKLIKRAAELKKQSEAEAKMEPLPKFEPEDASPDDPIVKAVQEATDEIEALRKKDSESLAKLARYLGELESEMKQKKGIWVEKISHSAAP